MLYVGMNGESKCQKFVISCIFDHDIFELNVLLYCYFEEFLLLFEFLGYH